MDTKQHLALLAGAWLALEPAAGQAMSAETRQVTREPCGHILTNIGVWSPDGEWIVYDVRSDPAGEKFDGTRIEAVHVRTGEVKVVYESRHGAHCGVPTFHPREPRVVFILGPENPTPEWQYGPCHRQGVVVDLNRPGHAVNLDARDLVPPYTPGALRGGSHVHVWDPAGQWVSFTYEDHVLASNTVETADRHLNLRNVGVSAPFGPVRVDKDHPRNHGGEWFSVLAARTVANPAPGSDQVSRAFEEGWVGTHGYLRPDGSRQRRALAFQGHVRTRTGETISEVFIADLPDDLTVPGDGPLAGTDLLRPFPPKGTRQRRLTRTADRRFPGIQGPRHWLRASPEGDRIAFLMRDDAGVVQLWTVSPNGGSPAQLTRNAHPVASSFTWSPDGRWIAHVMNGAVCITDASGGETTRLTVPDASGHEPRPEACVFSPNGREIAWVRPVPAAQGVFNQVFVTTLPR